MQATLGGFSTKLRPRGASRRDRYKEKKRKNIWTYFLKMLQVLAILNDVTSALGYLHNRRIIHRYLVVRNIALVSHTFWHSFSNCISCGEFFLVDLQGSEAWKCCLETRREQTCVQADRPRICQRTRSEWNTFVKYFLVLTIEHWLHRSAQVSSMAQSFVGTLQYVAPELFLGEKVGIHFSKAQIPRI